MLANEIFTKEDDEYIRRIRRELHSWPEIGFDTPRTLELVKRELAASDVPFRDDIGLASIVGYVNYDCADQYTVAIRADMDALPVEEKTGLPFASQRKGIMHACGHDAHMAILLGTARVLKRIESSLPCRVKLIFQACEETAVDKRSGAKFMCDDGVMDDVDVVVGLHVDPIYECGTVGIHPGHSATSSNPITIDFYGKTAHATSPEGGSDALAMGVKFVNDYQYVLTRCVSPTSFVASSICSFITDNDSYNVVADHSRIKMTLRTYDDEVNDQIEGRIRQIADNAAKEMGGMAEVQAGINYPSFDNDLKLSAELMKSFGKVVGKDRAVETGLNLASEDFAFFARLKPGAMFRLGIRNESKACVHPLHSNYFDVDEDSLQIGVKSFVQFVIDRRRP